MEDKKFVKLKDLTTFRINRLVKYYWSKWNEKEKRYEHSNTFQKYVDGFRKKYIFDIGDSLLELGGNQLKDLLILCFNYQKGLFEPIFGVKTSGEGKEIRYYFNISKKQPEEKQPDEKLNLEKDLKEVENPALDYPKEEREEEEMSSIPF